MAVVEFEVSLDGREGGEPGRIEFRERVLRI